MTDLWLDCRARGGMAGAALPCSGAVGDQPAALMEAFAILDAAVPEQP